MKCRACNDTLTDVESVLKDKRTNEYYDMCGTCLVAYKEALTELEEENGIVYAQKYSEIEL